MVTRVVMVDGSGNADDEVSAILAVKSSSLSVADMNGGTFASRIALPSCGLDGEGRGLTRLLGSASGSTS